MASILVAYDEERGIGRLNNLPWHLPEDMRRFKELTTGHVCIMGRKTWESVPPKYRPFPNRVNYVVSKSSFANPKGFYESFIPQKDAPVWGVWNVGEAVNLARTYYPERHIFIIGGDQIYKSALDLGLVDKIIASVVAGKHDCDVFFPVIDESEWSCKDIESFEKFKVVEMSRK